MNNIVSLSFFFVWLMVASFVPAKICYGDLASAVHKYANETVNHDSLRKLREFDHLIKYFTSFSYFVPRHKVSPDFVKALILAESGANPKAISKKNAIGLGQIIPSTGKEAARELAKTTTTFRYVTKNTLKNLQKDDLFDPAVNILLTCYLIAKYNYKFNGELDLVVSAWNAGENTKSLKSGNHAPYQETENLIGKVNAYYVYLLKSNRSK